MPAINKLTARAVEAARVTTGEKLLGDGDGLYLRVRPEAKAWLYIFSTPGGRRKLMLGAYPTHGLADARAWAADQRRLVAQGQDPAAARRPQAPVSVKTTGDLLDAYAASLTGRASHRQVLNILKHVPEAVRGVPAKDADAAILTQPIRALVEADKVRSAGALRTAIRAAFSMAFGAANNPNAPSSMLGFGIKHNVAADLLPVAGGNGAPEERALSTDELRAYAAALDALPAGDEKDLLRLQLFTGGQRLKQIMRGTFEADTTSMVLMDIKGRGRRAQPRRHVVPLLGPAADILEARGGRMFDFGDEDAIEKALLRLSWIVRKISEGMDGAPFNLRSIRRSCETALASLGVSKDVRAQLLSHGLSSLQDRAYDRHSYAAEKQAAVAALQQLLLEPIAAPDQDSAA